MMIRWVLAWVCWAALGAQAFAASVLPDYSQVRQAYRASDILVLDRHGELVQRLRQDYAGRRGDWVELAQVSPALQNAVLWSEDRRFYSHHGVDWRGVAAAAWQTLWAGNRRGASTVTMQLVDLIDADRSGRTARRSLLDKVDQAIRAQELERIWSKPQLLEAYLNLAPFRGELIGVDAVSRVLFQKHPSGLDARESALAAVMLRAPNVSAALLEKRACALLVQMRLERECEGLESFIYQRLRNSAARRADSDGLAPHFARWVASRTKSQAGARMQTTIDASLQRFLVRTVHDQLSALRHANVRDAAVVVLDNRSGQVLAYVGSSGALSSAAWVDHAQSLRQAGSTLKPFLYEQAIEQQRLTAASLVHDSPLNLPTGNGLYIPQNYDLGFAGWVSVRTALASSLNIPAVRALTMVGPDAFQQRLVRLGLPLDRGGGFYGFSLALGSADVSLLTLTNAYRALANLGAYTPVQPDAGAVKGPVADQAMAADAAWIVGDMLSDRHSRSRTFGLDSPLTTPFWTAVKTGTSKDMRDNWCLGWSEHYTVGVWAGNSAGDSMRDVSGVTAAGPIWHATMLYLHRSLASSQPAAPPDVQASQVWFEGNVEPPRTDYFLGDTAMSIVQRASTLLPEHESKPHIASPVAGAIVALDPDIPAASQRVWLAATGMSARLPKDLGWRVGNEIVGTGAQLAWKPRPGRHEIELLDAQGQVLDRSFIVVRSFR